MSRTDDIADLRDDMDLVAQRFENAAVAAAGANDRGAFGGDQWPAGTLS